MDDKKARNKAEADAPGDWERLAAAGFSKGVRVRSPKTLTHWKPRPLRAGDGEEALGIGGNPSTVGVSFDGEPPMKGTLNFEDICKEQVLGY